MTADHWFLDIFVTSVNMKIAATQPCQLCIDRNPASRKEVSSTYCDLYDGIIYIDYAGDSQCGSQ